MALIYLNPQPVAYETALFWASSITVVFYSSTDKQAYMLDGASAALRILRARLSSPPYAQNASDEAQTLLSSIDIGSRSMPSLVAIPHVLLYQDPSSVTTLGDAVLEIIFSLRDLVGLYMELNLLDRCTSLLKDRLVAFEFDALVQAWPELEPVQSDLPPYALACTHKENGERGPPC
ncbi:hypothetical protein Slin15195_G061870 [Septoria linicola]|uniref:Uncharacterized protein n=1 Tax=Septoria linicola TaxID=215465 RepID=A0A9Q9ATG1_9PEZI|nr:hypothetical protein Slin15195_G061870 [Septoria linicola]